MHKTFLIFLMKVSAVSTAYPKNSVADPGNLKLKNCAFVEHISARIWLFLVLGTLKGGGAPAATETEGRQTRQNETNILNREIWET